MLYNDEENEQLHTSDIIVVENNQIGLLPSNESSSVRIINEINQIVDDSDNDADQLGETSIIRLPTDQTEANTNSGQNQIIFLNNQENPSNQNENRINNNQPAVERTRQIEQHELIESSGENDEDDSDDDDYVKPRYKIPRLHSNLDLKASTSNNNDANKSNGGGDEETCSICFEPWTNSGIHRLVCLKCGHLFGEGCIDRWIKSNPKCPQCNRPAKRSDIRRIYARSLKVLDTAELDKALKDLEAEKQLRKKAEIAASEMKLQYQLVNEDLVSMRNKYKTLLAQYNQQSSNSVSSNLYSSSNITNSTEKTGFGGSMNYNLDKLINITDISGGCRVVAFSSRHSALLVSQPSNNAIFPGFGIKKINFLDYKLSQYIPIHTKLIRDMAINPLNDDGIVLTCSLDKMIKLTNLSNNALVHGFDCGFNVWSCCYNLDNPIYFYAGLGNGNVLTFDKRKIDRHVEVLNSESNTGSPVCSLQYVPRNTQSSFNRSGLLVTQLDKLSFFESKLNEEYKYHPLLVESNIMSCSFEVQTRHLLVSTRPSQKHSNVRHLVYELSNSTNDQATTESNCSLNLIQTYVGSNVQKMLAKSKLFYHNSQLYGCAPEELSKSVVIWDVSKNETCTKLSNSNDVLDICPINFNQNNYLVSLTDKQLRIFKKTLE